MLAILPDKGVVFVAPRSTPMSPVCRNCRRPEVDLIFGRFCRDCWRRHTIRDLEQASWEYLDEKVGPRCTVAEQAHGTPPTRFTIVAGPDGRSRTGYSPRQLASDPKEEAQR